jgi:mono/diheme cytochrome c family protein
VLNSRLCAMVMSVSVSVGLTAGLASRSMAAPAETSDQSIAAGKLLYNGVGCWSCHGFNGQGAMSRGIASGPHINARVLPLEAFAHQLRSPLSAMPPYTEAVLTDAQVVDIYNYLRSLPLPPSLKDIPLLNPNSAAHN